MTVEFRGQYESLCYRHYFILITTKRKSCRRFFSAQQRLRLLRLSLRHSLFSPFSLFWYRRLSLLLRPFLNRLFFLLLFLDKPSLSLSPLLLLIHCHIVLKSPQELIRHLSPDTILCYTGRINVQKPLNHKIKDLTCVMLHPLRVLSRVLIVQFTFFRFSCIY